MKNQITFLALLSLLSLQPNLAFAHAHERANKN